MILLHHDDGRDTGLAAPCTVHGYPLGPGNFETAVRILLRDDFSGIRYAHWCDDAALMAGRAYRVIVGVVVHGQMKVASYFGGCNDTPVDSLLSRLAAYSNAGITPDDVDNVIGNHNDAREYRSLLA